MLSRVGFEPKTLGVVESGVGTIIFIIKICELHELIETKTVTEEVEHGSRTLRDLILTTISCGEVNNRRFKRQDIRTVL